MSSLLRNSFRADYRILAETDTLTGLQRQKVEPYLNTVADRLFLLQTRQKGPPQDKPRVGRYVNDGKPKKATKRQAPSAERQPRSKKARFTEVGAELYAYSQPSQSSTGTQSTLGSQNTPDTIPSLVDRDVSFTKKDMLLTQNPSCGAPARQLALRDPRQSPPPMNSIIATFTENKSEVWFAFAREETNSGWKVEWLENVDALDVRYRVVKVKANTKRDKVDQNCAAV